MKLHPELTEKWVQELIAADPSILGLGDLQLRQKERIQPRAGRLDLLLEEPETKRRYEVEIQLGATNESHIIRTIKYWNIERKRYPQYDHCAVLIAEDITSGLLDVVALFNGTMPFVAIKMQALKIGDQVTVVFTKVMDELTLGLVDEDEEAEAAPTNRAYWEDKASTQTVAMADQLLTIAREFDPALELKYNKFYIGLAKNNRANNFVTFIPKRTTLNFEPRISQADEVDGKIANAGLETLAYDKIWGRYRIVLGKDDVKKQEAPLRELMRLAFEQ